MIAHAGVVEHAAVVVAAGAAVAIYGMAWLRSPSPHWWPMLAWTAGVVALVAATAPPAERWAAESFTGHMAQHLGMLVVAPPLLVAARPVVTIGRLRPGHRPPGRRLAARWRTWSPIVAPICFVVVLFGTHLTSLYDLALQHRMIHDAEHLAYLAAAIGLWAVVSARGRTAAVARVGAAFAVIGASAVLGIVLTSASRPLIDTYVETLGWRSALADQRRAGSLMWVGGMGLGLPLVMLAVWRWAAAEQRTVDRAEALANGSDERRGEPVDLVLSETV